MNRIVMLDRNGRKNIGARTTCKAIKTLLKQYDIEIIGTFDNNFAEQFGRDVSPYELAEKILDSEDEKIKELLGKIEASDGVIINGEGSLILSKRKRPELILYLAMLVVADKLQKKSLYINAVCSPDYDGYIDWKLLGEAQNILQKTALFAVRDEKSFRFAKANGFGTVRYIPEALFGWIKYLDGSRSMPLGQMYFAYPEDDFEDDAFDFDNDYILLGGYMSYAGKFYSYENEKEAYGKLIRFLQQKTRNVYLAETGGEERLLRDVSSEYDIGLIKYNVNSVMYAYLLANARLYISGRFHPSILASLGGCPCIMLSSNCHKSEGFNLYFKEYEKEKVVTDLSQNAEMEMILQRAEYYLSNNEIRENIMLKSQNLAAAVYEEYKALKDL